MPVALFTGTPDVQALSKISSVEEGGDTCCGEGSDGEICDFNTGDSGFLG
jgi:hypothetical protein